MKKEVKAVIAVVLAVWFFLMGFEIGGYREKKKINSETTAAVPVINTPSSTAAPETTTIPIETSALTTAAETTVAQDGTTVTDNGETTKKAADNTTKASEEDPVALSKTQIVEKVASALNAAKAEQNMKAVKTEIVTIKVTDCSVKAAVNTINNIINKLAGEETITYQFTGGQAVGIDAEGKEADDGATVTPNDVIPPKAKNFNLPEAGVKNATAAKEGENTVYTIALNPEDTTYESPVPQYHSNAYGYLDLTSLDLSGVTFTEANMHYPNTVITATVNKDGKLVKIHF
ncbi:MAG: hypothetical protein ACI4XE_02890, partial [Acutalibacteraceae bacterium]